jgi:REP element-mobilizing transposase RayT
MARPIRIVYEGAVYHVTMRGNNRKLIFKGDPDRERFVTTLAESVGSFEIRLYLFCLMRNHVHLNPVFVGAHRSQPTRERIRILRSYVWSSYRSYIGAAKRLGFVDDGPVLEMMGRPKKRQRSTYRRFVESGISDIDARGSRTSTVRS